MRETLLIVFISFGLGNFCFGQDRYVDRDSIDIPYLNKHILIEVNKLRKKAKVPPLINDSLLFAPADDHVNHLLKKERISHYQRFKWKKKSPKNRTDYYGAFFDIIGENVLQNYIDPPKPKRKKDPTQHTYKTLAEKLVLQWKNSPPHYKNMITPHYLSTFVSIAVNEDGELYACQLLGGSHYFDKYEESNPKIKFKRDNKRRCIGCRLRPPMGHVEVLPDSTILFSYHNSRIFKLSIFGSRMRFFNPWRDGLVADIVVKSQYPCDSAIFHNGVSNVRGTPLEPVYKKDFGHVGMFNTHVVLGKVPSYLTEEFEVNLTVIQNKRPCSNTLYTILPSAYHVDIPLEFQLEPLNEKRMVITKDSLSNQLFFEKSKIEPIDISQLDSLIRLEQKKNVITDIQLDAYASIEGNFKNNQTLYKSRAQYLLEKLSKTNNDTSRIEIKTSENFKDFRKDILGTEFENLQLKSDEELKSLLMERSLSDSMEGILKNHRFVRLKAKMSDTTYFDYTKSTLYPKLQSAINANKKDSALHYQKIEFQLIRDGIIDLNDFNEITVPFDKKHLKVLHDRAIMLFELYNFDTDSLEAFVEKFDQLIEIKPRDRELKTTRAILYDRLYYTGRSGIKRDKYLDTLRKKSDIDKRIQARMILNYASARDWGYRNKRYQWSSSKFFYPKVKRYIKPAKLSIDKTFEIGTYYGYFGEERYAYNLLNGMVEKTENADDLIYFLKLIYYLDVRLPESTILRYFKKIRNHSGDKFCEYFNSPDLNFQILDNPKIKEIYCEECADVKP